MKCCKKPICASDIMPFLDESLQMLYRAACLEYGTPAEDRVYCPTLKCSTFLGSAAASNSSRVGQGRTLTCQTCNIAVCVECREKVHPGEGCQESKDLQKTIQLAEEQKWMKCPKCRQIVERTAGCNHMVCVCTEEFCYKCGRLWRPRTCSC